ncbi:MAG: S-layer homology domain-containing protein [Clostridia bacterium]|nr:S-layer homology domain-containing protein [Clostridia bacterium]
MKRKVLSLILAMVMLLSCMGTVFAAAPTNVTISGTNLKDMVAFLADNTPDTLARRQEILDYIKMYMATAAAGPNPDRNMDTLISAVKNKDFSSLGVNSSDLQNIFNNLNQPGKEHIYAASLFTLELLRALPTTKRADVINGFGVKQNGERTSFAWQTAGDTTARDSALVALYNTEDIYPAALRTAMEAHTAMETAKAPYIVLNLFTAFKDCFKFTDDATTASDFAAYRVYDAYDGKLMARMGDYTLDSAVITDADQILEALASAINNSYDAATKANIKTVLADEGLALYVPLADLNVALDKLEINGTQTSAYDSTFDANRAPVEIGTDTFSVVATPVNTEKATVSYAIVNGPVDANTVWVNAISAEALANGTSKTVAFKIETDGGYNQNIQYVNISRPTIDYDVAISSITTNIPGLAAEFDPQVKDYTVNVDGNATYNIEAVIDALSPANGATVTYAVGEIGDDVTAMNFGTGATKAEAMIAENDSAKFVIKVENNGKTVYYTFAIYADPAALTGVEVEGFTLTPSFAPDTTAYGPDELTSENGDFMIKVTSVNPSTTITYGFTTIDADPSTFVSVATNPYDASSGIRDILSYEEETMVVVKSVNGSDVKYYTFQLERGVNPAATTTPSPSKPNRRPSSSSSDDEPIVPSPSPVPSTFPDTVNHWAKDYIEALADKGLFVGDENGNFNPNWGITRQEMAVVLVRMMGFEAELGSTADVTYSDKDAIAAWAYDYVALLSEKGIYTGYDDGEFKPLRVLSREEIVALAMRLFGLNHADATLTYRDAEHIGEWSRKYIGQATSLGIVEGTEDKMFLPKRDVTRAEASKILYNYLYLKGEL